MQAFITLLSTPNYLPGVLCLARSLRDTGTEYPLHVALSHGVSARVEEALHKEQLPTLRLPAESPLPRTLEQKGHHWSYTFDKLHLFGLTQFSKLVYLDSDMMILSNIDELFGKPHMSAVAAGQLLNPGWNRMNSGLMVLEPQAGLPARIGETLDNALREAAADRRDVLGDQDLINAFYPDWPASGSLQLHQGYNVFHPDLDAYVRSGHYAWPSSAERPSTAPQPIKVLHFIGGLKPWTVKAAAKHLVGRIQGTTPQLQSQTFAMYRKLLARSS
jgi:glycogenin glucosyltransferase